MPGYEELTPDQLIYIVELVFLMIIIYGVIQLIRTLLTLKISKNVKKLELMIENKYEDGVKKPSLSESIKTWWSERKAKKDLDNPYKVPKKFR